MKSYQIRIKYIFGFIFLFFLLILYRLVILQIFQRLEPTEVARTLEPKRGKILDRNYQEIAITMDEASVNDRFKKKRKRAYPNNELASNVIGFTGRDENGLEGIEYAFDSVMRGKAGILSTKRDAWGKSIVSKSHEVESAQDGNDVVLCLDEFIQHIAEQELMQVFKEREAKGGSVIVMDPYTGEILAMANVPTYNPNKFWKYSGNSRRNRAISDCFEPGSTMKIFTSVAAFEEKVVRRDEILNCEKNTLIVGGHVVRDSHEHHKMTFQEVLEQSSNIGIIRVALRIGKDKLYNYFTKFGFGRKTGLDFPGEAKGKLISPENWSGTSITAIPIGQEISVTTLQLANGISIVANGGYEVTPYLIKEIRSPKGKILKQTKPKIGEKIISDSSLKEVKLMLESVVEEGTGKKSKMDDYTSGVKTGTAQKYVNGYDSKNIVLTYVGYAPLNNPRLAIVIVLDNPDKPGWAEGILGPVFKNIASRSLHYLNVIPDKKQLDDQADNTNENKKKNRETLLARNFQNNTMPDVSDMSIKKVIDIVSTLNMEVRIIGSGVAYKQTPAAGTKIEKGGTCIIYFSQK